MPSSPLNFKKGDLVIDRNDKHGILISLEKIPIFSEDFICEVLFTSAAKPDRIMLSSLRKVNP